MHVHTYLYKTARCKNKRKSPYTIITVILNCSLSTCAIHLLMVLLTDLVKKPKHPHTDAHHRGQKKPKGVVTQECKIQAYLDTKVMADVI